MSYKHNNLSFDEHDLGAFRKFCNNWKLREGSEIDTFNVSLLEKKKKRTLIIHWKSGNTTKVKYKTPEDRDKDYSDWQFLEETWYKMCIPEDDDNGF